MSSICDHERAAVERRLTELKTSIYTLDDRHSTVAVARRNSELQEVLREIRELQSLLDHG
jgi:hypothetical protein